MLFKVCGYLSLASFLLHIGRPLSAMPQWTEQGPADIVQSQIGQACGAINAIAIDPDHRNRIFVATVNGGIWRTSNGLDTHPYWEPLTDGLPSLATNGVSISPIDPNRLYAGLGDYSNGMDTGNAPGVLRSDDGGQIWSVQGAAIFDDLRIWRVIPTGLLGPAGQEIVLVAATSTAENLAGGVFRSDDSGNSFTRTLAADLVQGGIGDLARDPLEPSRLIAGVPARGIFITDNAGQTWVDVTSNLAGLANTNQASFFRLAISQTGDRAIYALVASTVCALYRSLDSGASWVSLPSLPPGFCRIYDTSLAADPISPDTAFVGGIPGVFRWSLTGGAWEAMNGARCNNTATHADSRSIAFDSANELLQCDDGGIYRLADPNDIEGNREWRPMIGNMRVGELFTVAYDSLNDAYLSGTQDNGVIRQVSGEPEYKARQELGGDGNQVAVDNDTFFDKALYYSNNNRSVEGIRRATYTASGELEDGSVLQLPLRVDGTTQTIYEVDPRALRPRFILGKTRPERMLISTEGGFLFESTTPPAGFELTNLGSIGFVSGSGGTSAGAWVYGGVSGGVENPELIYMGIGAQLRLREGGAAAPAVLNTYPGGQIVDVAVDPTDWRSVFVLDSQNRVWMSKAAGATAGGWNDLRGNLPALSGGLRAIEAFRSADTGCCILVVAGKDGAFVSHSPDTGFWTPLGWLSNAIVTDLHYSAADDVLIAATYGRGVWSLPNASRQIVAVALRWASVRGSPAQIAPSGVGEPDTDNVLWRRHERASDEIWIPGAMITFRSGMLADVRDLSSFPVVEDPHPPEGGGPGALGDILDPIYDDGLELRRLHHAALVAWTEQHPAARGPIVLNIGRFVDLAGNPVDRQGGRTGAVVSRILCDAPLLIAEVQDSSALVVVEDNLFSLLTDSKDATLAHQLGHYLGLGHGNGLDDDNNGQLDGICDLGEDPFFLPLSLMSPDDFVGNEVVTSTQAGLARIKALRIPGINETVAATRTDSIEEVSNPLVDMGSFSMAVNPCLGKATLLHDMFADESEDGQRWLAFLDTDGLAGTGGAPAALGFPTSFQGAELVTRIENRLVGEFLQLVPTVWRFENGLFVEVNDPSIEVEGGVVQDLHGPFNYSLSFLLRLDVQLIGGAQALLGHPIRAQVLSQLADVVDRLPDAPAPVTGVSDHGKVHSAPATGAFGDSGFVELFLGQPMYPLVTVRPGSQFPGGRLQVEASGLFPDAMFKVFIGDEMVGTGMTDGTGTCSTAFRIDPQALSGSRLITVGNVGTALTADAVIEIRPSDETPPPICPEQAMATLWPPNHEYERIDIAQLAGIFDPTGLDVAIDVDSILQDEPVSGVGSGVTVCDARHEGNGIVLLRKERFGRGNGRVYHVHYTATNTAGMSCEGVVLVSVPHDQDTLALDDGELFDSTVGCQGLGMR